MWDVTDCRKAQAAERCARSQTVTVLCKVTDWRELCKVSGVQVTAYRLALGCHRLQREASAGGCGVWEVTGCRKAQAAERCAR